LYKCVKTLNCKNGLKDNCIWSNGTYYVVLSQKGESMQEARKEILIEQRKLLTLRMQQRTKRWYFVGNCWQQNSVILCTTVQATIQWQQY